MLTHNNGYDIVKNTIGLLMSVVSHLLSSLQPLLDTYAVMTGDINPRTFLQFLIPYIPILKALGLSFA